MNIFELNFLIIIFYAFLFLIAAGKVEHSKKMFIIAVTVQLIIINGLRNVSVGVDTFRYERHFNNIANLSSVKELINYGSDIGYVFFQKIVSLFSSDFQTFLIFVAIIIFFLLGIFIYKYSSGYFISYLLFISLGLYHFSFTGIRQSISMIIILWTYKFILEKKAVKFFIVVLIASLFHSSALIFTPMYFLARIKWNRLYFIVLVMIFTVFYLLRNQIGSLLTIIYYEENAGIMLDSYESSQGIGGLTLLLLIVLILGILIYNPFKSSNRENIVLSNIMLLAFFIQNLSSFSYLFTRLNMYYLIFIIIYIPFLFNNIDKAPIKLNFQEEKGIKIIFKLIFIIIISIYYFSLINGEMEGLLPYKFYWE